MKPIDYLEKVYNKESFNFQFKKVHIFNGTSRIASFDGTTYIRKLSPTYGGGMATSFSYADVLEELQKYGVMLGFSFGHYDFLAQWRGHDENAIIHYDFDSIQSFTLTAIDVPGKTDIALAISVPPFHVLFTDCYNLKFSDETEV